MSRTNKRAIAGLSMGGYGALYHVLTHRELFGACYAMSAATGVIDRRGEDERDVDSEYYDSHNIVKLIQNAEYDPQDPDWRKRFFPMVFLDCGDDDYLFRGNCAGQLLLQHVSIDNQLMDRFSARMAGTVREHHFTRLVDIGEAQLRIKYQYRRPQAVQY